MTVAFKARWAWAMLPIVALLGQTAEARAASPPIATAASAPIEIRLVIVTAFEIGADTGDKAGEFQAWATDMPQRLPFPAGFRDLRYDPVRKVLLLSTGIGTSRAASSTMALGLDPRFDLTHAYWMVAAIAGANPNEASIGSAAWIGDVIDTDYGYLIDPREAPAGWTSGMVPRERSTPYEAPLPSDPTYNLFPLNHGLRDWAYRLTRDTPLADSADLKTIRARYAGFPKAQTPPQVLTGDEASGQGFWHGKLLNAHTERWVSYWTGGAGRFVMTAMEDTGVISAVGRLQRAGKADASRVMVLRTASNYSMPPAGEDAAASLVAESHGLSGLQPSLDAAHAVGGRIVAEIAGRWDRYRDRVPGAAPAPGAAAH